MSSKVLSYVSVESVPQTSATAAFPDPSPGISDFDVLLLISRTKSSSVYLVRDKATQKLYALKQAPKKAQAADVEQEQYILKSIAGLQDAPESLLSLVASWSDSEYFYVLTSWCAGKDLSSLLTSGRCFSGNRTKEYMVQLVVAVQALHNLKVVHRDIKPANVFVTQDGNVVLGDVGLAKCFGSSFTNGFTEPAEILFDVDPNASAGSFLKPTEDDMSCTTGERCGTLHWMSPAQYDGTPYSFDADVWSLGVLMFQMSTGKLPFGENTTTSAELRAAYAKDPIAFKSEYGLAADAQDLISGMLVKDANVRMTLDEVKAHPYFLGVDWTMAGRHRGPTPWAPPAAFVPKDAPRRTLIQTGVAHEGLDSFAFVKPGFYKEPNAFKALAAKVVRVFSAKTKPKATPIEAPQEKTETLFGVGSRARKVKSSSVSTCAPPVVKPLVSKIRLLFRRDRSATPCAPVLARSEPDTQGCVMICCRAHSNFPAPRKRTLIGRIRQLIGWRRAPRPAVLPNGDVLMPNGIVKGKVEGDIGRSSSDGSALAKWFRARFCVKNSKPKSKYVDLGMVSADSLYW
ncbi:kinase-like domain-containing protein [Mycena metata]|uniref:Kinase-like domain-containing protein n=1 Tax=Mycena metata TaxID=1033252 RepID=A0AAD7K560_9AGAR|nr:kinase-like domain-containing protein [Mycena metata]